MSWREFNLIENRKYEVTDHYSTITDAVIKGEVVEFKESNYSPYDNATMLKFKRESGEVLVLFIHDETDIPDIFRELRK